jgi:hypothetical protein
MDVKTATVILLKNLKGRKNKPQNLVDVAEACRTLKDHDKWGFEEMSRFFKVSVYMLRQIDKINDLNPSVKRLVREGEIKIEKAYQLSRLSGKRQDEAAPEVVNLSAHETRKFIDLLLKSDASVAECKKLLKETTLKQFNLLVLPMKDDTYRALKKSADKANATLHDHALSILEGYLRER